MSTAELARSDPEYTKMNKDSWPTGSSMSRGHIAKLCPSHISYLLDWDAGKGTASFLMLLLKVPAPSRPWRQRLSVLSCLPILSDIFPTKDSRNSIVTASCILVWEVMEWDTWLCLHLYANLFGKQTAWTHHCHTKGTWFNSYTLVFSHLYHKASPTQN